MVTVNWIINAHKILVTPIVLALMWHYHNWSTAAFLYLGLNGTYTLLWLIKQSLFADKRFAQPIPLWIGVLTPFWPTQVLDQALRIDRLASSHHTREIKLDRAGAVFVSNGISAAHQSYFANGGLGFLLGDGGLTYGRETIVEAFYDAHIWRGAYVSFDLQHVNNPGYNQVRGPVSVPGLRLHLEF